MSPTPLHGLMPAFPHLHVAVVRITVLCVAAGFFAFDQARAAPKKDRDPFPQASIGYVLDPETKKRSDVPLSVERGGSLEFFLKGVKMPGRVVEFEVDQRPRFGSLSNLRRVGGDTYVGTYTPDSSQESATDQVVFKLQTDPENAWGRITLGINILEPPARLEFEPDRLDFGTVPIGETRVKTLRLRNGGGGLLEGTIQLGIPWSLQGPAEIALEAGEERTVDVAFSPWGPDEQRGRLSIKMPTAGTEFLVLTGEGTFRFAVREPVVFKPVPGGAPLEIPVTNLTGDVLELLVHAPPPLISAATLWLPPRGETVLKLDVQKKHYLGKTVELTLRDRDAVRGVRVELPPPPALLDWAHPNATLDLGDIPFRNTARPEPELRNLGSTAAVVELRDSGEGWSLQKNQAPSIEIPPGETVKIPTIWKLPEKTGPASARLIASHGGIDHSLLASANVLPEEKPPAGSSPPAPAPSPSPKPAPVAKAPSTEVKNFLCETYPGFWNRNSSTTLLSWTRQDPSPVDYRVRALFPAPRKSLVDALEERGQRFEIPEEPPPPRPKFEWKEFPGEFDTADGRWKSRIHDLPPGWRNVQIIAVDSNKIPQEPISYNIFVPVTPWPSPGLRWLLSGMAALFLIYLLRRPLGRLLPPQKK